MRIHAPIDLGLAVRERRKALRLDQRALAAKVGVSRQWVIDLEKGRPGAALGLVLRTLDQLGLQLTVDSGEPSSRPGRAAARLAGVDIDAIIDRARGRR